jgi:hypothetical protein
MLKSTRQLKQQVELLVHKLSEVVTLVLSPADKIWLCPGVADMLGWQDKELINGNLANLVNSADTLSCSRTVCMLDNICGSDQVRIWRQGS